MSIESDADLAVAIRDFLTKKGIAASSRENKVYINIVDMKRFSANREYHVSDFNRVCDNVKSIIEVNFRGNKLFWKEKRQFYMILEVIFLG